MTYAIVSLLLGALLFSTVAAAAEPERASFDFKHASTLAPPTNLDGLCDRAIHAAGVGVASGKVVFVRERADGQHETVSAILGSARVMPVLDVGFHGASMMARVVF